MDEGERGGGKVNLHLITFSLGYHTTPLVLLFFCSHAHLLTWLLSYRIGIGISISTTIEFRGVEGKREERRARQDKARQVEPSRAERFVVLHCCDNRITV